MMRQFVFAAGICLVGLAAAVPARSEDAALRDMANRLNDYPTEARADYVFGCMAANGQGRMMLRHCACSIDMIASILPYEQYEKAETVLAMQQGSGEKMSAFKTMHMATEIVAQLRRAQAEAEMLCF